MSERFFKSTGWVNPSISINKSTHYPHGDRGTGANLKAERGKINLIDLTLAGRIKYLYFQG
nr:hypothetical protein HAGR004_05790 [Bdellovibrio sp. HAGR004]